MNRQHWLVTDTTTDVHLAELELGPTDFTGDRTVGLRVSKRTLRGGLSDGVEVLDVENGALRVRLLPTRGMGIHRVWCGDVELGWRSPVQGPVHPNLVDLHEPSGIGWLSGFDELLCRCGLESNGGPEWNGAGRLQYPLHGRIANLPAHRVEVAVDGHAGEITATGVVDEARLFGRKLRLTSQLKLRGGEATLHVTDEVRNLSSEATDFELLYHINFGLPMLQPGAQLIAPAVEIAPRDDHSGADVARYADYPAAQPGLPEYVHFFRMATRDNGQTAVLLKTAEDRGVCLRYDARALPCFTQWKCLQPAADGYVTGLEPGTNYPNERSFEEKQGRTVRLSPGESRRFELSLEVLASAQRIAEVEQEVRAIVGDERPRISQAPQPGWSPLAKG